MIFYSYCIIFINNVFIFLDIFIIIFNVIIVRFSIISNLFTIRISWLLIRLCLKFNIVLCDIIVIMSILILRCRLIIHSSSDNAVNKVLFITKFEAFDACVFLYHEFDSANGAHYHLKNFFITTFYLKYSTS